MTEAFFSFMGGLVVKKSTWDSVPSNEAFVGSCWALAARLFEIMPQAFDRKVCGQTYLYRRGANDLFMDKGLVNRLRIAIEGFHRLADTFFGHDSMEAFHVRRVLKNDFSVTVFSAAAQLCREKPETESKTLLDALVRQTYCDGSARDWRNRFLYAFYPLIAGVRRLYLATFNLKTRILVRKILTSIRSKR